MRRFMQTFVLAPQSPKKYYVHNDIFRYQDEVFQDNSDTESEDHQQVEASSSGKLNPGQMSLNYYQGSNDPPAEIVLTQAQVSGSIISPSPAAAASIVQQQQHHLMHHHQHIHHEDTKPIQVSEPAVVINQQNTAVDNNEHGLLNGHINTDQHIHHHQQQHKTPPPQRVKDMDKPINENINEGNKVSTSSIGKEEHKLNDGNQGFD
jgi:Ras GTPase-activating protein-binding protein 1